MDQNLRIKLLQAVHQYYSIGMPMAQSWNNDLIKVMKEKTGGTAKYMSHWEELLAQLRQKEPKVENALYLQFPSLMLRIEYSELNQSITVVKTLVVCLSLLCPFYTYYYEYQHKVKISDGLLPFNSFIFFSQPNFESLKTPFSRQEIDQAMKLHFPNYTFVSHYFLMMNKIIGGVPYGLDPGNYTQEYDFYQFLFCPEHSDSVFQ